MHCDKLLFYICLSKKKPYRAYVVMLLYSTVNKSFMSMSNNAIFKTRVEFLLPFSIYNNIK